MNNQHTSIVDLQRNLDKHPGLPLKFYFDGTVINPGYHVTEVKFASIRSLDCGRKSDTEHWDELTIQLLDGSTNITQSHMSGSKFTAIVAKALEKLSAEDAPLLYFEYAPNNGPIRKLSVESIESTPNEISVSLGGEKAVCKPFQRLKTAARSNAISTTSSGTGCCSDGTDSKDSACCD